ncbi:MAG: class I adenylate-forming enzyme family protein [Gaiellaceae bacterium]
MAERPGEHNLARLTEQSLDRHGDRDALFFEDEWHSSGRLFERACRLASGLTQLGIGAGDRVVVLMSNCPEIRIAYSAIWRAGAAITPAIFLLSAAELRHVLVDSEASALMTTPELAATVRDTGTDVKTIVAGDTVDSVSFAELEQTDPGEIVPRGDDELAALLYTGGTTGRAKGVMLSHEAIWRAGKAGHDASYIPGINRSLVTLPLSHSYGLLVTAAALHAVEAPTTALLRWFDPLAFLSLVEERELQVSALVPSMVQALLVAPLEDYELGSLRQIVCGAAPLAPESIRAFADRLPQVELREGYGLTETSALVSTNPPGAVRPGSVGKPVAGVELRVANERDEELPPGEVGEICCRMPFVMLGYWRDPAQTADVLRGGWLHTGDMGYVDEDGYLFVVDRKKDLIIRGGFNVFPRDVEDALLEHPAVVAVGVVGRPDEERGEEVVAFVALRPGDELTDEELVAYAKERIGGYKYPREVRIVPSVPLTPVGKVDRKALRALAQERSG